MIKVYCDICGEFIDEWEPNQSGYHSANKANFLQLTRLVSKGVEGGKDHTESYAFEFSEIWKERKWCIECFYKILKDHFDYKVYKSGAKASESNL